MVVLLSWRWFDPGKNTRQIPIQPSLTRVLTLPLTVVKQQKYHHVMISCLEGIANLSYKLGSPVRAAGLWAPPSECVK